MKSDLLVSDNQNQVSKTSEQLCCGLHKRSQSVRPYTYAFNPWISRNKKMSVLKHTVKADRHKGESRSLKSESIMEDTFDDIKK